MSALSHPDLAALVGSWRLVSWVNRSVETGEAWATFGARPEGRMVLEPGGRIMFLFMTEGRRPPAGDADRVRMFNEMVAYTGRVRLDGPGRFVTMVDVSWSPFAQAEQLRLFELEGERLVVRTLPQEIPVYPGRTVVGEVVWVRE